jgi:hypothetical protein
MSKLDVFSKFQPLTLNLNKDDEKETIDIEGIATTEHQDSAGEIILQDGIDWSYCLKNGAFNYDHQNEPRFIVGAPQSVNRIKHRGKNATSIKGILYAKKQIVKDLVENYKAMKSAGDIRQLGFSIEGQVLARDNKNPHIITRAKVLNVSLTHQPCNTEATVALVKSILTDMEKTETMEKQYDDLPMTYKQSKMLEDYSEKLCALLKSMPMDADLPEWVQGKITKALDYLQAAYHYLEVEMQEEMDKDIDALREEVVDAPEDVEPPLYDRDNDYPQSFEMEKGYYKSDEEMDKMDRQQMMEYARFLEGLKKEKIDYEDGEDPKSKAQKLLEIHPELADPEIMAEIHSQMDKMSDLSPIQPESLEDDEQPLASEDMNMEPMDKEDMPEVEMPEGLSPEELKQLILGMLEMGLPVDKMQEYIKQYCS